MENRTYSTKVIYPELSYKTTGLLFEVHKELGSYGREKQYGDALEDKLKQAGLHYKREIRVNDSGNIIDFVVDDSIAIELKASRAITKDNYRQLQNYLQHSRLKLGLLVNFREKYLKPVRIVRIDS